MVRSFLSPSRPQTAPLLSGTRHRNIPFPSGTQKSLRRVVIPSCGSHPWDRAPLNSFHLWSFQSAYQLGSSSCGTPSWRRWDEVSSHVAQGALNVIVWSIARCILYWVVLFSALRVIMGSGSAALNTIKERHTCSRSFYERPSSRRRRIQRVGHHRRWHKWWAPISNHRSI